MKHAGCIDEHEFGDQLGPLAGDECRDGSTHRMTDQVHGTTAAFAFDEFGDEAGVVSRVKAMACGGRFAEAGQVRRNDVELVCERVEHGREVSRRILAEAMHEHERGQ